MNLNEVKEMIRAMNCCWLKITDTSNYNKAVIDAGTVQEALDKLDEYIPMLTSLGEIYIYGKTKKDVGDGRAGSYSWKVTLGIKPTDAKGVTTGTLGFGGEFGIKDLIGIVVDRERANLEAAKREYELEKKFDEKLRKLEEKNSGLNDLLPMGIPLVMQMMDFPKEQVALAWAKVPGFSKVAKPITAEVPTNTDTFETDEEKLAQMCLDKMILMRKSGWTPKEIFTLLESAEKLGRVKEPALLIELVTRSINTPTAVDDALIFLRAKQQ